MGKLASGTSFQMKLAFLDEDLKKPKHDDIMFWLTEWVKDPANVRTLVSLPYRRTAIYDNRLEPDAEAVWKAAKDTPYHGFQSGDRSTKESSQGEPWKNEPELIFKFETAKWEVPLKENNRTVAFADLQCVYEYCRDLFGWHTRYYDATHDPTAGYGDRWKHKETRRALSFTQVPDRLSIFFEVKSEITSVGDLMRQLNFYSELLREKDSYRSGMPPILAVVAPPHAEAEGVCRAHGFAFVNYAPATQ